MCPLQEPRIIFVDETPQCGEEAKQNESYLQTSMAFAMNGLKLRWNKWADFLKKKKEKKIWCPWLHKTITQKSWNDAWRGILNFPLKGRFFLKILCILEGHYPDF